MCGAEQGAVRDYWRNIMHEKIEVLGISVEKCYVEDVMECVNENWFKEALSTYGVINMKLLMAAQEDEKLKKYISILDKAVVDEPEVLKAAGVEDKRLEEEASRHGFFSTLFWFLSHYKNQVFLLGETEEDTEAFCHFVEEKYPDIVIVGKDSLQEAHADQIDRVINEINSFSPQAVLTCSRNMGIERFVADNRKMMNTKILFCLGERQEIQQETGLKKGWLGILLEKSKFKKLVSQYNEENEDTGKGEE